MIIQLSYDEIKNLASGKVDTFSLWYVNCSKIHILFKIRKFLMTHTINLDVDVKEIKDNRVYLYYDGNISFLANVALKMGWVKLPSFIEKRSGNEIVINLRCVPSFSRSFELQNITFYNNEVHVKLNIKKVL